MSPSPFDDLEQLFDRMEAQFEGSTTMGTSSTAVDVIEEPDAFLVNAELPGFETEDIDLSYGDGQLYLQGERSELVERADDASFLRRERTATIDRTIPIPEQIDAESIEADFEAGVLTVTLPKLDPDDEDGGKPIEIE